jgi:hypothetical protein
MSEMHESNPLFQGLVSVLDSREGDNQMNLTPTENNPVHEAVLFYWGERCPEHEDGCPTCVAWGMYDRMIGENK